MWYDVTSGSCRSVQWQRHFRSKVNITSCLYVYKKFKTWSRGKVEMEDRILYLKETLQSHFKWLFVYAEAHTECWHWMKQTPVRLSSSEWSLKIIPGTKSHTQGSTLKQPYVITSSFMACSHSSSDLTLLYLQRLSSPVSTEQTWLTTFRKSS